MPAPATRPRFMPRLKPCGSVSASSARIERTSSSSTSANSAVTRSPRSPTCRNGATIRCPGLYGNEFKITNASSPRTRILVRSSSSSAGRSQKMQPASSPCCLVAWMYAIRQGDQMRSTPSPGVLASAAEPRLGQALGGRLVDERGREVVERHALGLDALPVAHGELARLDLLVPDHEHIGGLRELCGADLLPDSLSALVHGGTKPERPQERDELPRMPEVTVGDGHQTDLLRREPERERAPIVLDQHGAEALERAEDRSVDHHRSMPLVVLTDVLEPEPLREREVALHRRQLPQSADRVAEVEVHLRAVEGSLTLGLGPRETAPIQGSRECLGGALGHLGFEDRLTRQGRKVDHGLEEAERPEDLEREVEDVQDLVHQLVGRTEDVRVILGTTPDPQEAVQRPDTFVPVDGAELGQPHRQVAVRARFRLEDEHVERAVHGLDVVVAGVGPHRRVPIVRVPLAVTPLLPPPPPGDMRRHDEVVAALEVQVPDIVLQLLAEDPALRMPHPQARSELLRRGEQVELAPEAAVVALLGLHEPMQIIIELLLARPRGPIDPREHRPTFVA